MFASTHCLLLTKYLPSLNASGYVPRIENGAMKAAMVAVVRYGLSLRMGLTTSSLVPVN